MKQTLPYLFLLFFVSGFSQQSQDLSGKWFWKSPNGQNTMELQLTYENQNRINGTHCVVFNKEGKTDCRNNEVGTFSINLVKIAKGIYDGTIESAVSLSSGKIRLQYIESEKTIRFYLKEVPLGEFYIPKEAFLIQ